MNKLTCAIKLGIVNWVHKISNMIVFIVDKDYLGKGLAVDAIIKGNEKAFNKHNLRKLYGSMYKDNIASVKVYLKTGWVIEDIYQAN